MTPALLILAILAAATIASIAVAVCANLILSMFNWIKCRIKVKQDEKYEKVLTQVIYKDVDYDDHKEFVKQKFDLSNSSERFLALKDPFDDETFSTGPSLLS